MCRGGPFAGFVPSCFVHLGTLRTKFHSHLKRDRNDAGDYMDAHHALVVAARDEDQLVRDILRKGVQPTAMPGGDWVPHSAAAAGHGRSSRPPLRGR